MQGALTISFILVYPSLYVEEGSYGTMMDDVC